MKRLLGILAVFSLVGPVVAHASDFMDIRLSWVLAEDNLLVEPGETLDNSPGPGIGDGYNTFFDNYDTKYTGFETFGHLVLYKKMPAFFERSYAETALFLRLDRNLRDEGSYITFIYDYSDGADTSSNIQLILFPLNSDRFRLGYSYDISWGGNGIFHGDDAEDRLVPGAKLEVNLPWGYAYLGFKTTRIQEHIKDTLQTEMVTNYGVLGGLGIDIAGFRAETCGGYFSRGVFAQEGVRGRNIYAGGVSYQIGYHQGTEIGSSIDFELYKNDPDMEYHFFKPEVYDGGLSWVLKHEGTLVFQRLEDPDAYGELSTQAARAFDVNFALKLGYLRIHLDAVYRSLSCVLLSVPGFTPYQDFPDAATAEPEMWAAAGLDYHFPGPRLTPGLKFGVKRPATYTFENLDIGGIGFSGTRTVVIQKPDHRAVLPPDTGAVLLWSVKGSLKWDYAESLAVVAEAYYTRDENQIRYVSDFSGLNMMSEFAEPNIIGINLMAQARY